VQKWEAGENVTFSIKSCRRNELAMQMHELSDCVSDFAKKCLSGSIPKAVSADEKKVMCLFHELTVISKKLWGSTGYKLCCRNEICSLTCAFGIPALFITLNLHDLSNVLVGHFRGCSEGEWRMMSSYQRAAFIASHPAAACLAFHKQIQAFIDIVL
ncbi:hypothetical protein M404DRAFT_168843, partial [Pisolithus tinctorius Marx 270]